MGMNHLKILEGPIDKFIPCPNALYQYPLSDMVQCHKKLKRNVDFLKKKDKDKERNIN